MCALLLPSVESLSWNSCLVADVFQENSFCMAIKGICKDIKYSSGDAVSC